MLHSVSKLWITVAACVGPKVNVILGSGKFVAAFGLIYSFLMWKISTWQTLNQYHHLALSMIHFKRIIVFFVDSIRPSIVLMDTLYVQSYLYSVKVQLVVQEEQEHQCKIQFLIGVELTRGFITSGATKPKMQVDLLRRLDSLQLINRLLFM